MSDSPEPVLDNETIAKLLAWNSAANNRAFAAALTPEPSQRSYHFIIVDMRGFLDGARSDKTDYVQIAAGPEAIPKELRELTAVWKNKEGKAEPIKGLYEVGNPLRAARFVRQRIHFIGFVAEQDYSKYELGSAVYHVPNPFLFQHNSAPEIYGLYPMKSIDDT